MSCEKKLGTITWQLHCFQHYIYEKHKHQEKQNKTSIIFTEREKGILIIMKILSRIS